MNKVFGLFLPFLIALSAHAGDVRTFKKINSNSASVRIETEAKEGIQAASYLDGVENAQFINMLLDDPQSRLSILKRELEMENCGTTSTQPDGWIPGCGGVELTGTVRTSFGRGGWMEGGSAYTFFVGFRFAGTGHFFDASHMVTFTEGVIAEVDSDMNYAGFITKSLALDKIVALPIQDKN